MATYNKVFPALVGLVEGMNCGTDAWKLILVTTVTPPTSASTNKASVSEVSTGNGYTTGGVALTVSTHTQSAGTYSLVFTTPANPTWTASGAGFSFQYVCLWNSTTDAIVAWWDYGSAVTMNGTNADTFTVTLTTAFTLS